MTQCTVWQWQRVEHSVKYFCAMLNIFDSGSRPGGAAEETLRQGQGAEAGAEEQQQEKR